MSESFWRQSARRYEGDRCCLRTVLTGDRTNARVLSWNKANSDGATITSATESVKEAQQGDDKA